jgi:hypothetical protein
LLLLLMPAIQLQTVRLRSSQASNWAPPPACLPFLVC